MKSSRPHRRVRAGAAMSLPSPTEGAIADLRVKLFCPQQEAPMSDKRNVLWIMADQLRFDYLSCAGHPTLQTPHLDALAARGVRFDRAYVQSPFCGPSRASYYTGRYCRSHGATWNGFSGSRRRVLGRCFVVEECDQRLQLLCGLFDPS